MLKVTSTVFGVYQHGKLKGKTNPNESVSFTGVGKTPAKAMQSLGTPVYDEKNDIVDFDMPIYKVEKVVNLNQGNA